MIRRLSIHRFGACLAASALALAGTGPLRATGTASPSGEAPQVKADSAPGKMKTLPPAELDDTLAIGGSDIDGRKISSRMTVAVRVNNSGPYRFVVDSGADTSVVGERIASQLSLPAGRRTILNSITDTSIVNRVLVDELSVGPTSVYNLELPVLRERNLGAQGMLGLDALVEQRLMLDFEKRVITVDEGRTPAPRFDGEIVVVARLRRGQLILTQVRANGQRIDAVVDTGSEVSIGNSVLRDKLLRRGAKFTEVEVTGVTGTRITMQMARVRELRLGSIILQNVPLAFADIPPFQAFGIDKEPSLLVGTDLMENFRRVSLDFHNRKVRFQLKRCAATSIVLSTSTTISRLASDRPAACSR